MKKITCFGLSIIGKRETNQDKFVIVEEKNNYKLVAVADGMGGNYGGEVASKIAIDAIVDVFSERIRFIKSDKELKGVLREMFLSAQEEIADEIEYSSELSGMGTTLSCMIIHNDKYVWGNIGDSRIYQICDSNISQITTDHSVIQEYLDLGKGDPPIKFVQQYGNIITKSLGEGMDEADIFPVKEHFSKIKNNTTFIVCSDGLITDKSIKVNEEFKDIIINSSSIEEATNVLVDTACSNGSTDNITAVLVSNSNFIKKEKSNNKKEILPKEKKNHSNKNKIIRIITFIVFSIIILASVYLFYIRYFPMNSNNLINQVKIQPHIKNNNDEQITKKLSLEVNWIGFENNKDLDINISKISDNLISWYVIDPMNVLDHYFLRSINLSNNDTLFEKSTTKNNISPKKLKISNKGDYKIEIFAILNDDTQKKGKNHSKIIHVK